MCHFTYWRSLAFYWIALGSSIHCVLWSHFIFQPRWASELPSNICNRIPGISAQMFFIHPNLNIFKIEIIFTFKSALLPFSLLSYLPNFPGEKSRIIFDFFHLLLFQIDLNLYPLLFNSTASVSVSASTISCWIRAQCANSSPCIQSFLLQTILTLQQELMF